MSEVEREAIAEMFAAILATPMGREWVERDDSRVRFERMLLDLTKRGLSDRLRGELWTNGNMEMVREVAALSDAQIAELNAAHKARA